MGKANRTTRLRLVPGASLGLALLLFVAGSSVFAQASTPSRAFFALSAADVSNAGKNVRQLHLLGVRPSNVEGLGKLPSLAEVHVKADEFTKQDVQALKACAKLESLSLSVPVTFKPEDLERLSSFAGLRRLVFKSAHFTDGAIPKLAALAGLRALCLHDCILSREDWAGLSTVKTLKSLDLTGSGSAVDTPWAFIAALVELDELILKFTSIATKDLANLKEMKLLARLDISLTTVDHNLVDELCKLESLRHLSVESCGLIGAKPVRWSRLRTLCSLNLSRTPVHQELFEELEKLPHLDVLGLAVCNIDDAGLSKLAALSGLRDVDLGFNDGIKDRQGLQRFVDRQERLERLRVDRLPCVTDEFLDYLHKARPNIRGLALSHCANVTGIGLSSLTKFAELEQLAVRQLKDVTDAMLEKLMSMPKLRELDISMCYSLTFDGILRAARAFRGTRVSVWALKAIDKDALVKLQRAQPLVEFARLEP